MNCTFTMLADGTHECGQCGYRTKRAYASAPQRNCTSAPPGPRLTRYAKAVQRWTAAGKPTRTDEEVEHIVETHCKPCEHFTGKGCRKCGCKISKIRSAMVNKVRMATESCPIGKW